MSSDKQYKDKCLQSNPKCSYHRYHIFPFLPHPCNTTKVIVFRAGWHTLSITSAEAWTPSPHEKTKIESAALISSFLGLILDLIKDFWHKNLSQLSQLSQAPFAPMYLSFHLKLFTTSLSSFWASSTS